MALALPSGPRGQLLAIGMTVAGAALLWLAEVTPLLAWRADLADTRDRREALAGRMAAVSATLPALQRQVEATTASGPPVQALIEGASDAVAAAALQEKIQDLARGAGVTLSSTEALPAEAAGRARRIGIRLSLSGTWPTVIGFLQASAQSAPRMLVDDLQMQRAPTLLGAERPLDVSLAVFGFRAP